MSRIHPLINEILLLEREHAAAPAQHKLKRQIALEAAMARATVQIDDITDRLRAIEHHANRLQQTHNLQDWENGKKILEIIHPPKGSTT